MKLAEDLKKSVLQAAMQGKLSEQKESDSSVDELLEKIAKEKESLINEGKIKREKPLAEITEDEIPFEIPQNWRWERWGNLSNSIQYGFNASAVSSGYAKMVRISDIQDNKINWDTVPYCEITESEYEKYELNNSDLLFARTGGTVGKSVLVSGMTERSVYAGYLIRSHYNQNLNPQYLKYFMESPLYWVQLTQGTTKGCQPNCNGQTLSQMILPLPPIEEQQRIVEKLNQILPLIDEYAKEEDELIELCRSFPEEMKKSVLQAAMQGKLSEQKESDSSVDELLEKIAKEKESLIKDGKIKREKPLSEITEDEIPFEIPERWRWCRLGTIGSFLRGSGIKRTETVSKGYPCVRYGELYTTYKHSFSETKSFVPKEIFDKAFKIETNDICMALTGENKFDIALASVYLGKEPIAMGGDMTRFRTYFCNPLYFVYAINSTYGINCKQKLATGDIICHISNDKLANIIFPLPPIEEQQRIVEKLKSILPVIDSMAVYGTKKKAGRPKTEEALAFVKAVAKGHFDKLNDRGFGKGVFGKPNQRTSEKVVEPVETTADISTSSMSGRKNGRFENLNDLTAKAKTELPPVVQKYAGLMGVSYKAITIRHQKTRWGSCTKTGNLSLNCLLVKMPQSVRDYVIIHELSHLKELNHSKKFWAVVEQYCPWYRDAKQWLKENGGELMGSTPSC